MSDKTEISSNALALISNDDKSPPNNVLEKVSNSNGDAEKADSAPRIICNELIVDSNNSKSLEKLDELSSLEREIAKMHHADEAHFDLEDCATENADNKTITDIDKDIASNISVNDNPEGKIPVNDDSVEHIDVEAKLDAITSGESALEHEDLIAVLKGLDSNAEEALDNNEPEAKLEGVTIEGEGEYQIMEVIDEDSNATEDNTKQVGGAVSSSDTAVQNYNKKLTPQQERALALEQMECLKTVHRRRKQDIKPIMEIDSTLDLVTALEADWSEHEEEIAELQKLESKSKQLSNKNKTTSTTASENKNSSSLITSVVVIPPSAALVSATTIPISTSTSIISSNASVSSNNNSKDEEKMSSKSSIEGIIETKTEKDTQIVSSQSGFRRTRIIKRKIIWDPDAPETTFSYAKLVKTKNNSQKKLEPGLTATATKKGSTTITPIKKEVLPTTSQNSAKKIQQRPTTPKAKRTTTDSNIEKASSVKTEKSNVPLKHVIEKDVIKSDNKIEDSNAKPAPEENVAAPTITTSPQKRRSQTPVANGPAGTTGAKKKKITEVDRLMRDEGAVNMLNSLEKLEATLGTGEVKPSRPMMRSRAATICEKLPRKETTSPVRSTTTTTSPTTITTSTTQTNKGKRTPKSRASSSWDYVYKKKKQDFDDSLIIRRRSNSSYSSTASLNRSSLDGPPTAISGNNSSSSSTKRNDSLPATTNENQSLKTSSTESIPGKSTGSSKSRSTQPAGKSFEFAKPESKKSQKRTKSPAATLTNDMKSTAPIAGKRSVRSPATTSEEKSKDGNKAQSTKSPTNIKEKKDSTTLSTGAVSDVVVKKSFKVAQILFSTNKAKLNNTFTIQMLNKLVDILDKLASDPDCHVVVIGTNDDHFCQGIDITDLITISDEKRKNYALNLATSAKNYLKTLATYPKPVIGGVNGNISNFGVIQLALFDIVIASDKTTFEMPYAKMGQTPEGYCLWHNMNKIRGSFKTKLFWLCEKVQSTEAALAGLVNKLTTSNKVNDDALMTAKRIASYSVESYRAMKKTVIHTHLDVIVNTLDEEFNTIIKQWTSSECLENLKKIIGHERSF